MTTITKQNKWVQFFEYMIALILVLNANSIYVYFTRSNTLTFLLLLFLVVSILFLLVGKKFSVEKWNRCFLSLVIWTAYTFIYIVLRPVNFLGDLHLWITVSLLLIYFTLYWSCGNKSILLKYQQCIYVIALVSLIMWVICSQLKLVSMSGLINSVWKGADKVESIPNYFFIYFETQTVDILGMTNVIRNSAIFTEAPMAALHFSIALMIELFMKKKPSIKRTIVFIIAIVSTLSTTGLILAVMCVAYLIIFNKPKSRGLQHIKPFFVLISVIVATVVCVNLVVAKFGSNSGSIRLDDFVAGYKAWCENILFGNGGGEANQLVLEKYMSSFRMYNTGFSNSIMRVLSERGLYGGLVYAACFISAIICSIRERDCKKLFFTLFFLYLFIVTVMPYLYLTLFILIFLVKSKNASYVNCGQCINGSDSNYKSKKIINEGKS